MTAEQVFKLYRAYKFFYAGTYDIRKYGGKMKHPPFSQQRDRPFYHRLSVRLNDAQIHGLFTQGFFYKPSAHISELATPDAQKKGLAFASRAEGEHVLRNDLYEVAKVFQEGDISEWLYGTSDTSIPECLQSLISGELPIDVAALLLLIPQKDLNYNWPAYWAEKPDMGLGPQPWIARLKQADQLLAMQREGWRLKSHRLAKEFWSTLNLPLEPPVFKQEPSLWQ